ncbi:Uncharacterised protein [Zhongshania aliphaticivorans]|uniref:tRNA-queuosine alpha-mannosyltransferase n=1 Tax=Zhongshania aliphaticivorans TaxID=1470434 RepID=A0A5S9QC39_9GAMM|nr:Uncharacterised protein [Zhongshania aliphaticivorans]CAA0114791.1 Uncharacterised protein [Zhongshania aliphaticivorans]
MLSAYHADSHRYWLEGLMTHLPNIKWTVLSLPPRYFSWRIRGNSLTWAMQQRDTLTASYDLLIATSMTDLSALRGLVPELCKIPTVVYFHENQFAYPQSSRQREGVEPQMLNLYTALAADKVLFNSHYNRRSFLDGVDNLMRRLPDFTPRLEVAAELADAMILPVGLSSANYVKRAAGDRLRVLWNHRWEYDKGPDRLQELVKACSSAALPVDFYVAGQQFRQEPKEFNDIKSIILASDTLTLCQWGYVSDHNEYKAILSSCDIVLSTAIHDFQGLSVLQAVTMGCVPLVPERLCYPEWFGRDYCYLASDNVAEEAANCLAKLQYFMAQKRLGKLAAVDVSALSWEVLAPKYAEVFRDLVTCRVNW